MGKKMKNLILLVTFLVSSASFAGEHCDISGVYFKQESNGSLADTSDLALKFNKKGKRALEARNYHYRGKGHKSLIIESDCKDGNGFETTVCEVKAKIYCNKEQKVEAIAYRYSATAAEVRHGKMGARMMIRAIHGLPKCVEHEHKEE